MAVRDPLGPAVHGDHLTHSASPITASTAPDAIAELIGHRFRDPRLLREALTHRSAAPGAGSNERLEFVGDRVLGLLIAEWLAERFPAEQEGALGRRLAALVAQPTLAAVARAEQLADALEIAPHDAGARRSATVLADAIEAVIGALYFDGGLDAARGFVRRAWAEAMAAQGAPPIDAKTELQEWAQARGLPLPRYAVARREGPPHAPRFCVSVTLGDAQGTGTAGVKRAAEQQAAADLLARLAG
jgi:ribonuclease-3